MKKLLVIILALLIITTLGCTGNIHKPDTRETVGFPRTITDDLNRTITVRDKPGRIVSLSPSSTEILFALGLGDKVVGVTDYCNYPPEAQSVDKVGGFSTPNIEAVLAKNPDLVVASSATGEENVQRMTTLDIPVIVLEPRDIDDVLHDIRLVGRATGAEENATRLINDMQRRITAVEENASKADHRPRTVYILWHDPLMAAGRDTFVDDLIRRAGGENIAEVDGYKTINMESIVAKDPEVIITSTSTGDEMSTYKYVKNSSLLQETTAGQNDRIYSINGDIINRGGPRIVVALERIAGMIHPDNR